MSTPYRRTRPQLLADLAPCVGMAALIAAQFLGVDTWLQAFACLVGVFLVALGMERTTIYRHQRDAMRRCLVGVLRWCDKDHAARADAFEDLVPDDVLAEAFPQAGGSDV